MEKPVHYVVVAYWERSGSKIVADYPTDRDATYRSIVLNTVNAMRSHEDDKISVARGNFTVHVLIGELHYACLTPTSDNPLVADRIESHSHRFLQRVRSIYGELPILADLSQDLQNLSTIDLSKPLAKVFDEYNQQDISVNGMIEKLEGELAEIRRTLMDGVQKLIDRGQRLDDLVRKTQTLQITARTDFRVLTRTPRKKNALVATAAGILMFVSTSLFVLLIYIGFL